MPDAKLIYKHYDQESLDKQYNNRLNVPDHEVHTKQWESLSRETEEKYPLVKNIRYGDLTGETLDIFPSDQPQSKVVVFIHGGYWYKHKPADFYFVAEAFKAYPVSTVLIGYPLMPQHGMDQLVRSCRKAIQWIVKHIADYGADPDQLYLLGHSAGAHLALMMATERNDSLFPYQAIKGIGGLSGLYSLRPIWLSNLNEILQMTEEQVFINSPLNYTPAVNCPMLLCYGALETAEYHEQSLALHQSWSSQGAQTQLHKISEANHFSIVSLLLDRAAPLHESIRGLMGV